VARRLGNKEGKEHKNQGKQNAEATPLLRLRLLDIDCHTAVTSGLLTLWRPDGQLSGLLEEGRVLGLANCLVGGHHAGGGAATINLTASRATQYLDIGHPAAAAADTLPPEACRRLTNAGDVSSPDFRPGLEKTRVLTKKKTSPVGFFGFFWVPVFCFFLFFW
jgi:hypothetical protein